MAVEIRFSREVGEFGLRDRLSGLPNYRAFKTHLLREYQRAKQFRAPLSLILLDVDGFKEFNDHFGHAAGNEALRQVAEILTLSIRDQDILCRYGGGEFVVIVQEMAKKEVLSYADGIRCNIEQHRFLDGASQPNARLTVSGGVATYGVDTYRGAELLPLSKKALYRAKGSGKNQIKSPSDEKRSFVRMDAECSGDLWIMSINQKSFVTKNISEGGILFQTEAPLSAGEILKLQVNLGSHQGPFHCRVRVIRVIELEEGGGFEVASEFVGLDASERLRLSTLIQEMFSDDHD